MNNLVRETRVDKNGVTTRRWVRGASTISGPASNIPAPTAVTEGKSSAGKSKDDLMNEIISAINLREGDEAFLDRRDLFVIAARTNVEELAAIATVVPHTEEAVQGIRSVYQRLVAVEGVERAGELFTADLFNAFTTLSDHVAANSDEDVPSDDKYIDLLKLVIDTPEDDYPVLINTVVDRKMSDVDSIRDLLSTMKDKSIPALSEGVL